MKKQSKQRATVAPAATGPGAPLRQPQQEFKGKFPASARRNRLPQWKKIREFGKKESPFLAILLLTILSRLIFLTWHDVWIDEWDTVQQSETIQNQQSLQFPHYLAFWMFRLSLGLSHSVWGLRFPSGLCGILSVAFIYMLARRWLSRPQAVIVAALTLLSPFLLYLGFEARYYTIVFAWAVLSMYFASIAVQRHSFFFVFMALGAGLACYLTHPASAGVMVGELVWIAFMCLWGWKYWWNRYLGYRVFVRVLLALIVLVGGYLGIKTLMGFVPQFAVWKNQPLTGNVSLSWGFFLSHFRDFIVSPASSVHYDAIVYLGQALMAVGFILLWLRRPTLNLLLVLQYAITFRLLFLVRAGAPYTFKYSIHLLISQLIWMGCGLFFVAQIVGYAAGKIYVARRAWRPANQRVALPNQINRFSTSAVFIAGLVIFGLLYAPDYKRIIFKSLNPINEAVETISAQAAGSKPAIFAFGFPWMQLLNLKQYGFGGEYLKVLQRASFQNVDPSPEANADRILWQMQTRAYWDGSAWLVGSAVDDRETPILPVKLRNNLELVSTYPSLLWNQFWSFLYRIPAEPRLILAPYPQRFAVSIASDSATLTLNSLNPGTWRLSVSGSPRKIARMEIAGKRANPLDFDLVPGLHQMTLRFAPLENTPLENNQTHLIMTNPRAEDVYSMALSKPTINETPGMVCTDPSGTPTVQIGGGRFIDIPLARSIRPKSNLTLGLQASSTVGDSWIACLAGDDIKSILRFSPSEQKTLFSQNVLPPTGKSLRFLNVTGIPMCLDEEKTDPEPICNLYSLSVTQQGRSDISDSNLLKSWKWATVPGNRIPFFRDDENGLAIAWMQTEYVMAGWATGQTSETTAIDISLDGQDVLYNMVSMPVGFGDAQGLLLRTACRMSNPAYYDFALRIRYLDQQMKRDASLRVKYLPKPSISKSTEKSWIKILYADARQLGEEGFVIEIVCWPTQKMVPNYPSGTLTVEEFQFAP